MESGSRQKRGRSGVTSPLDLQPDKKKAVMVAKSSDAVSNVPLFNGKTKEELLNLPIPEGLTLYDLVRGPRALLEENTRMTLSERSLTDELSCPICLGVFHDTMTVKACLHRFCAECIEKCVRLGKKECPTCRTHISSRRSLRPDSNFDAIISQIFPNLNEYEEQNDKLIEESNKQHNYTVYQESVARGKQRQKANRTRKTGKTAATVTPAATTSASSRAAQAADKARQKASTSRASRSTTAPSASASASAGVPKTSSSPPSKSPPPPPPTTSPGADESNILFQLVRDPRDETLKELEKKFLKTSRRLTIGHLYKFISRKLNIEGEDAQKMQISVQPKPKSIVALSPELTLDEVYRKYWQSSSSQDLVLQYGINV